MSYTNGLDKPSDYFTTKLFTGNGGTNAITGVGFQPDWIWFKNRTSAQSHAIVDSVRGRKGLQSNATDTEYTLASGKDFGTFDSDGFTVLTPQQLNSFNYNTGSIVSWNWVAGTSFTNDASGTGIGSIDSAGSASDASGFSICSYTGTGSNATVKHGLSTTPSMIIHKRRDDASGWPTWHTFLGTGILELNENGASQGGSSYTNGTAPTSSVFSIGTSGDINADGGTFIAYCFAEKQGYSKFSNYKGNASTNGTFVHTGFKPAFVMVKKSAGTGSWAMQDNKRTPFNVQKKSLFANLSDAETDSANDAVDFLSNGFKFKSDTANYNTDGDAYIYMAFAEQPFVTSTGVPATAR